MENMARCAWAKGDLMERYHDDEWCVPLHDDAVLFEFLLLESFQAGLSWAIVLNKRENFRRALDGFDASKIAGYGEDKIESLMADASIVRNGRKLRAAVTNARVFLQIQAEFGSFDSYLWRFTNGQVVRQRVQPMPASSPLSDEISADLKRRGMKFVGTVIIYSFLQAAGMVDDHQPGCFKAHE